MDEISLYDYLIILRRRKWTIIATMLLFLLLAGAVLSIMPRTYEGRTSLLFPEQPDLGVGAQLAQIAGFALPGTASGLSGEGVCTTVLKSRTVSETILRRFDLDKRGLNYKDMQDHITVEKPKDGGLVLTCEVPTSWLKGRVPDATLRDRTAGLAADMANAYISELRKYSKSNSLFLGRKNRVYIEDQLARTKVELSGAEERLREFQETHPTLVPPEKGSAYAEKSLDLATSRTETDVALQEITGQIAEARAIWDARAPRGVSPEAVIDSPAIDDLRMQLAKLEVQRAALLEDFTEAHPDVVSLDQQISKTRDQVKSEVAGVISGAAGSASPAHQELLKQLVLLEVNRDGLVSRRSAVSDAMSDLEKRLSKLPSEEMAYARLLRDLKTTEAVYTTLLAEHAKARVTEGRDADDFIVLDKAVAADKPAKPRVLLTIAAALMIGLMLGVMLATVQSPKSGKRA